MTGLLQDIRQALRNLRRSFGFATVATLTLALGIGGATALFSVVNAVLIRPLPFGDPDRLVILWTELPRQDIREMRTRYSVFTQWHEQSRLLEDMAIFEPDYKTIAGNDGMERIPVAEVSGSFFEVLRVAPIAGTVFSLSDEQRRVDLAVLSHALWTKRFGADRQVIGKTLELGGRQYRIVAVMPDRFWFPTKAAQIWTLSASRDLEQLIGPVIARLRRGGTVEQARAEMTVIEERRDRGLEAKAIGTRVNLVPLFSHIAGKQTPRALSVLLAATVLLLLIACANVANLLLARGTTREREFAIRTSLGASRRRLISLMFTESLALSTLAGLLGVGVAYAGAKLLLAFAPPGLLRLDEADMSSEVVFFAIGISVLAALLFGIVPALRASQSEPVHSLKGLRTTSGTQGHSRIRAVFVVTQFALAVLLLTGSGLMIRSFLLIQAEDPGLEMKRLLSMRVSPPGLAKGDPRVVEFYRKVLERVEAVPGVEAAGVIDGIFLEEASGSNVLSIEGRAAAPEEAVPQLGWDVVSSEFFHAANVPLLAGRHFSDRDGMNSLPVAIINRALARRFWPTEDPLGRRFKFGPAAADRPWLTVVGIVGDIRQLGLDKRPMPVVFLPLSQNAWPWMDLMVRTSAGSPLQLAGAVRSAIRSVSSSVLLYDVNTVEQRFAAKTAQRQFQTWLLAIFSTTALALAGIGIYAVMSYAITQRTHEIGIRIALGARPTSVLQMALGNGLRLACLGLIVGLIGALSLTQILSSLLYAVTPTDPLTFAGAAIVLLGIGLLASYLPARRATKVDPVIALRSD